MCARKSSTSELFVVVVAFYLWECVRVREVSVHTSSYLRKTCAGIMCAEHRTRAHKTTASSENTRVACAVQLVAGLVWVCGLCNQGRPQFQRWTGSSTHCITTQMRVPRRLAALAQLPIYYIFITRLAGSNCIRVCYIKQVNY